MRDHLHQDHPSQAATPLTTVLDNRLRAIEKARENIRFRIGQIHKQLHSLEVEHASGSHTWISLERVSTLEEWVAKNKEKMSGRSKSIREQLEEDIAELQRNLDSLKAESERTRRSGQHLRARRASDLFVKDFLTLQRSIRRDREADPALVARLKRDAESAVEQWRKTVKQNPTRQNVLAMLQQIRTSELLGVDGDAVADALGLLGELASAHTRAAADEFRRSPTSKNFGDYLQAIRQAQLMGVSYDDLSVSKPPPKFDRTGDSYTVKAGDTLSSIAKMSYGAENRWPDIWMANFQAVRNPDQLITGAVLTIP